MVGYHEWVLHIWVVVLGEMDTVGTVYAAAGDLKGRDPRST